jgi:4-aminobutyrate aminotransferase
VVASRATPDDLLGVTDTRPEARDYPRIVVPPPGPRARAIVDRDRAWTSHAYIKEYPLAIARGRGVMVEDVDGNRFLDFMSGIAVSSTGYGHPKVVAAVQEAAGRFLHICGSDFYFEGMAALCEKLARVAPGSSRKRVFLSNSGTEAIEGAIKLTRHSTGRTAIIAFKGAFHGRTTGALALTSSKARQHAGFGPLLPDVHHVAYPDPYRFGAGDDAACLRDCLTNIEQDLFARHLDPGDVAAIFVEPVQGEGGYVFPPDGFLRALRELCDRHGILLVFDEIQCGMGRTGKMWACEHEGVEPDVLVAAKGLASGMPLGAFIVREAIDTWEGGAHGSTFGGNPLCCAAALATIDLVESELVQNAARLGARLLAGARELAANHAAIGNVRGRGLMVGMEFVKDRTTKEHDPAAARRLIDAAFERGLLILGCGKSVVRLAPPLVIDETDISTGIGLLRECLS